MCHDFGGVSGEALHFGTVPLEEFIDDQATNKLLLRISRLFYNQSEDLYMHLWKVFHTETTSRLRCPDLLEPFVVDTD